MNTQTRWWYCLKHNTVESDDGDCAGKNKLGPYPTREAAEHALETVHERNEAWEATDDDNRV